MEIDHYKQENTKTSEFVSFSIREYVAEIRKKYRKKCWPFGSLGDPDKYDDVFASYDQSVESSIMCSQNCPSGVHNIHSSDAKPEHKEASNSSNKEAFNIKVDRSQTTDMIESVGIIINNDICKLVNNGCPDLNSCRVINKAQNRPEISDNAIDESGRNHPRRKHEKFRLLSDILKSLDNVNTRFPTKTEDDVAKMSKNKMIPNRVEDSKFEKEEKPNSGSKHSNGNDLDDLSPVSGLRKTRIDDVDLQTMVKRRKVKQRKENDTKVAETANEDSEMEAVMLLATHFNEENPSAAPIDDAKRAQMIPSNMEVEELLEASKRMISNSPLVSSSSSGGSYRAAESGRDQEGFETGMNCACVQKKIRANLSLPVVDESIITKLYTPISSIAAIQNPAVYLVCSISRNPADFTIPNAKNVFMRGG